MDYLDRWVDMTPIRFRYTYVYTYICKFQIGTSELLIIQTHISIDHHFSIHQGCHKIDVAYDQLNL